MVDLPDLGHQVFHAGRRPLHTDMHQLRDAPTGLYLDPPLKDPVLDEVMVAVASLGVRLDAGTTLPAPR